MKVVRARPTLFAFPAHCFPTLPAALCVWLTLAGAPSAAARVTARTGQITLPTYPWTAIKHPYFRGTDGVNIYPYPMLDFLSRDKANRTYRTVVLENEYLRITFLPELGGKIHEVLDKTTGQPMFYVNHVIKPGLIGQCGAWTSGGVEWNTGPQGHTVSCLQPVDVLILDPEKDGSRSVAIGETERIYGTKWTVVVTLRPGRSFIEEHIRIYNPTETIRPYYFWNCTAVPNTPGFRFIYPMTLGTDHGAQKFFNWPIHEGKDLSRGTNYQDASSIFAWQCDQDFFGAYLDDLDRGIVSYANHHQVPGKKAWTWGQGGFGKMHQMDLTDADGPYNEVQTGPLLTQGEVGRLDPCEVVEWKEWWYPVHGIGGFNFANQDVAVNATREGSRLRLRMLGTGSWKSVTATVSRGNGEVKSARLALTPARAVEAILDLGTSSEAAHVSVSAGSQVLARFRLPLDLPARQPPEKRPAPQTASELAQAGWDDYLFARFPSAEREFNRALERDTNCISAHTGLAYLNLDRDPAATTASARKALEVDPNDGLARFALAVAQSRLGNDTEALDEAWKASLDPATAVASRALAAKVLIRLRRTDAAIAALSAPGPWQEDNVCRDRLAVALLERDQPKRAIEIARTSLERDPLGAFAQSILWRGGQADAGFDTLARGSPAMVLDLVTDHAALRQEEASWRLLQAFGRSDKDSGGNPLGFYWMAWFTAHPAPLHEFAPDTVPGLLRTARAPSTEGVFPHQRQLEPVLRWALEVDPRDGKAALCLGHLLFHLGRHAEGRELWQRAAELGTEPVIACRALGMAAKTLDGDLKSARNWLEKANRADPTDSIVARDLARVLFDLADKSSDAPDKRALQTQARDALRAAFPEGKGRSDFVSLLGRVQNRLGEYAETARMLDSVRVTVREGSREVHDLFEDAHLELGRAHLAAGRAAEALVEFTRALEYPENLATGKLENTREAHIQYLRGNALAALGRGPEALAAWRLAADEPASKDPKQEEARRQAREKLQRPAP